MRGHPKTDLYRSERENGLTYKEIAEKYGVSKQAVYQACAKMSPGHFKHYTTTQVIYPNLLRWLNKNRVCRAEMARRLGFAPWPKSFAKLSDWFSGRTFPQKKNIDQLIEITGLSYEELFSPVETEPKGTARWEKIVEGSFFRYVCTHCRVPEQVKTVMGKPAWDFCPNCGWPMEED